MTAPGTPAPKPDAPWDLSFLRVGALAALVCTVVGGLVVGVALTWADALTVLIGAAIVTAFFCVSGLVIAWAGKVDESWTLPAALGTFGVKLLVLVGLLRALPADGWLDLKVLGWTVVAGALLWSVVQMRWVWTRQLLYVTPPGPPAGAEGGTAESQVHPSEDPESRTTRG